MKTVYERFRNYSTFLITTPWKKECASFFCTSVYFLDRGVEYLHALFFTTEKDFRTSYRVLKVLNFTKGFFEILVLPLNDLIKSIASFITGVEYFYLSPIKQCQWAVEKKMVLVKKFSLLQILQSDFLKYLQNPLHKLKSAR